MGGGREDRLPSTQRRWGGEAGQRAGYLITCCLEPAECLHDSQPTIFTTLTQASPISRMLPHKCEERLHPPLTCLPTSPPLCRVAMSSACRTTRGPSGWLCGRLTSRECGPSLLRPAGGQQPGAPAPCPRPSGHSSRGPAAGRRLQQGEGARATAPTTSASTAATRGTGRRLAPPRSRGRGAGAGGVDGRRGPLRGDD